jgi:hypothetical protein
MNREEPDTYPLPTAGSKVWLTRDDDGSNAPDCREPFHPPKICMIATITTTNPYCNVELIINSY